MGGNRFGTKPAYEVIKSVGGGIHIGIVNLIRVTGKNDLSASADPSDYRFGFQRREILSLIDNHELVGNTAAANVTERFDHNAAGAHQVDTAAVFVAHVEVAQHFQ